MIDVDAVGMSNIVRSRNFNSSWRGKDE